MPEGPEVKLITDDINKKVKGMLLKSFNVDENSKYNSKSSTSSSKGNKSNKKHVIAGYSKFVKQLPMIVKEVICRGKQIFFCLEDDECNKIYINNNLGMSGIWVSGDVIGSPSNRTKHMNIWLTFISNNSDDEQFTLYFSDVRHFAHFGILFGEDEFKAKWNSVGPDVLSEQVEPEEWIEVMRSKDNWQICKALLDQKLFSGIGNYIKADALYKAKIMPDRIISSLTDKELKTIFKCVLQVMDKSYEDGGMSMRDYVSIYGVKGKYKTIIYGKKVDSKGNPIKTMTCADKRTTHYVEGIQQ